MSRKGYWHPLAPGRVRDPDYPKGSGRYGRTPTTRLTDQDFACLTPPYAAIVYRAMFLGMTAKQIVQDANLEITPGRVHQKLHKALDRIEKDREERYGRALAGLKENRDLAILYLEALQ